MKKSIFLSPMLAVPVFSGAAALPKEQHPNVLIFLVDDLGWNGLSCTGSDFYESPNVDRLASEGVRFTESYSACSVSSPSRASIQTGKFTARHGITDWIGDASGEQWRNWRGKRRHSKVLPADYRHSLDTAEFTMAEAFRSNGYKTYHIGKWHLGEEGSLPEDHGYDVNVAGDGAGLRGKMYFSPYGNTKLEDGPVGENLTLRLGKEAAALLKQHKKEENKPFFMMLNFFAVHSPLQCTREKWEYFREKAERMGIKDEAGAFVFDRTLPVRQYQDNPVYAGLISQMDDAVGVVMAELDRLGIEDETIVVFTSDNGGVSAGETYSTSNLPYRGGKGYQWEGGIRVPLIIKYPGCKNKGSLVSQTVIGTDIYPTVLDLSSLPLVPKQHVDGISLKPYLYNPEKEHVSRTLYWHYPHYGSQGGEPCSIIRDGDWKLIYYHEDFRYELYNMSIDKTEKWHLNAQYPEKLEILKYKLMAWLKENNAIMPAGDSEYNPVKEAEYRARNLKMETIKANKLRNSVLEKDFKPIDKWCQPEDKWWGEPAK